jgi:hypothetical protein
MIVLTGLVVRITTACVLVAAELLTATAARCETAVWQEQQPSVAPSPRTGAAMAYDSRRGVMVLFGGTVYPVNRFFGDTWEWDGTSWRESVPADAVPLARAGAGMAFDEQRERTIMVGGVGRGGALADTWEWDGENWSNLGEGPGCATGNMAVYDRRWNRVTLLCTDGGVTKETWAWDGSAWSLLTTEGPPLLIGFNAAYDGIGQVVLLCGGVPPGGGNSGATWAFDGSAWKAVAGWGPTPRGGASMAWDDDAGLVVLFGGATHEGMTFSDTWAWDGSGWRRLDATGPAGRGAHAMAYDSARRRVVLFGGTADPRTAPNVNEYGDTWELLFVGSACATDPECTSGRRVDGVCCAENCGVCQDCNAAGQEGVCTPVENRDDPDSCTGAATCDSVGVCTVKGGHSCAEVGDGTACQCDGGGGECQSGTCICLQHDGGKDADGGEDTDGGAPAHRGCECGVATRSEAGIRWVVGLALALRLARSRHRRRGY